MHKPTRLYACSLLHMEQHLPGSLDVLMFLFVYCLLSLLSFFLYFFLSCFFPYSDFYVPTRLGSEVYYCTYHTQWHTRSLGLLWTRDRPFAEAATCTTHNTLKTQTSMTPAGLETPIPASERPQTHALDRASTGVRRWKYSSRKSADRV
jgi:hypothetical protein